MRRVLVRYSRFACIFKERKLQNRYPRLDKPMYERKLSLPF